MKRLSCLLLALVLCSSLISPARAFTTSQSITPVLISSEISTVNGAELLVEHYVQNGAKITAYTFLDKSISQAEANTTINSLKLSSPTSPVARSSASGVPAPIATKYFENEDQNPSTVRGVASHHGTFCKSNIDLAYLWIEDGQSEVAFNDPEHTPEITVKRTFETTGLSIAISWPPSVSMSRTSYSCPEVGPISANFLTVDWPSVYCVTRGAGTGFSLTAITDVSMYVRDEHRVYASYVATTQNFRTGW